MKPLRRHRAIFAALVLALVAQLAAAQERTFTPELILTIRNIATVELSPDGTQAVFQVSRARRADERPGPAVSEIWMLNTRTGENARFTFNDRGDRSPQWSPDGGQLAFISQRGDSTISQVYIIQRNGGEARQLTRAENSVRQFRWSPDGTRIAYTMTDPKTREELQAEREGRDWTVADRNYKHTRLYVADVRSGDAKRVTRADMTVHDFDWSPDGRQFVVAAAPTPTVDDQFMKQRLFTIPAEGGELRPLTETEGKLGQPRWSPDGRWIAWLGAVSFNDPFAGSVFIVPAGGGARENLTPNYEGSANWLGWQPGMPSTLVFTAIERQASAAYTLTLPDKRREPLISQPIIYGSGPSFSRDGRRMAIVAHSPTHPLEIFFGEAANRPLKRMTTFNPQLNDVRLAEQEVVRWKSVDGLEIEGVLVKPLGYERGKRYPLVMQPHGGPESADQNGWMGSYSRWGQMLAARGYAVFYPNYRGSIGRGVAFAKADHRDLMGKEFQDMLAGIDHLVAQGIVDPRRVGVGGGSYGGYTSAWAATYASERFRAAIAWMGISNWYSMTGTSEIFLENSAVHWDLMMYDNFEIYWERSPIRHIRKANTPTLIIHGAADSRVPPGQSVELYTALKWKGVPAEFVTYPRAGHGVFERAHQLDFMNRVIDWFDRFLGAQREAQGASR